MQQCQIGQSSAVFVSENTVTIGEIVQRREIQTSDPDFINETAHNHISQLLLCDHLNQVFSRIFLFWEIGNLLLKKH